MSHLVIKLKSLSLKMPVITTCLIALLTFPQPESVSAADNDMESLDAGFRQMYNLDFPSAHKTFLTWQQLHPDDPLGPAAHAAAYLFAEFERLHILEIELFTGKLQNLRKSPRDSTIKAAFENELAKADRIAAEALARSSNDANALFARVLADGLRGNYAALIEKRNGPALKYLKSSRSAAEQLIAINPEYYDAYLAIGIENYLLGLRSAPVRWFLRISGAQTNKDRGIARLRVTAERGRYLAPYARLLLAIAALRDRDQATAKDLLHSLAREFPQNRLYRKELARLQS